MCRQLRGCQGKVNGATGSCLRKEVVLALQEAPLQRRAQGHYASMVAKMPLTWLFRRQCYVYTMELPGTGANREGITAGSGSNREGITAGTGSNREAMTYS